VKKSKNWVLKCENSDYVHRRCLQCTGPTFLDSVLRSVCWYAETGGCTWLWCEIRDECCSEHIFTSRIEFIIVNLTIFLKIFEYDFLLKKLLNFFNFPRLVLGNFTCNWTIRKHDEMVTELVLFLGVSWCCFVETNLFIIYYCAFFCREIVVVLKHTPLLYVLIFTTWGWFNLFYWFCLNWFNTKIKNMVFGDNLRIIEN